MQRCKSVQLLWSLKTAVKPFSNAYFPAKFRFDTAENEPAKIFANFARKFSEVPPQTIDKLRKRFDEFDADGSGYIDFEEFGVMFCQLLKVKESGRRPSGAAS